MKILKIRLKNINSLKGPWEVNLDEAPISNAGLFAITGATGSGKTSLLDAITLALYGNTARFKDVSGSVVGFTGGVLTRHCSDAMAEVEFEVKGKKYKSNWTIKVNKDGIPGTPAMRLSDMDSGLDITQNKSTTIAKVEEIIGLNQNQFLQSVLLSQGRFKEFMDASPDNRALLLEKITGAKIYREIGKQVYNEYTSITKLKDSLQNKINQEQLILPEEKEKLRVDLIEIQQFLEETEPKINQLNSCVNDWNNFLETDQQKKDLLIEFQKNKDLIEAFKPNVVKIQQHSKAVKFIPDLKVLDLKAETISHFKNDETKLRSEWEKLEKKRAASKQNIIQLLAEGTGDAFFNDTNFYLSKIRELKSEIEGSLKILESDKKQIANYIKNGKSNKYLESDLQDSINQTVVEKYIVENRNETKGLCNGEEEDLVLIKSIIDRCQQFLTGDYPVLYTAFKDEEVIQAKIQSLQVLLQQAEIKKSELTASLSSFSDEKITLAKDLSFAQMAFDLAKSKLELRAYRHMVRNGEPCPLCNTNVSADFDDSDPVVNEAEANLVQLTRKVEQLNITVAQVDAELNSVNASIVQHKKELSVSLDTKNLLQAELGKKLNSSGQNSITTFHDLIELEKNTKLDLQRNERFLFLAQQNLFLNDFKSFIIEHSANKSKHDTLRVKIKELVRDEQQIDRLEILENEWITTTTELQLKKLEQEKKAREIIELVMERKENSFELLQRIVSDGFTSEDDLRKQLLEDKELTHLQKQREDLDKQAGKIKTQLDENQKRLVLLSAKLANASPLQEVKKQLDSLSQKKEECLVRKGSISTILKGEEEKLGRIKGYESELESLSRHYHLLDIMNKDIGDNDGDKFSRIVQRFTLRKLVAMANVRLKKLMDRYLLCIEEQTVEEDNSKRKQSVVNKKLDQLMVIDCYQGNTRRGVVTLSGGESFLISLSLALALSDLASGNIQIDTLFIDEGFGTLDPETLDLAISTLEKLQQEVGKTVGVISHVESLKERISCQVVLTKEKSGYSTLKVKE